MLRGACCAVKRRVAEIAPEEGFVAFARLFGADLSDALKIWAEFPTKLQAGISADAEKPPFIDAVWYAIRRKGR